MGNCRHYQRENGKNNEINRWITDRIDIKRQDKNNGIFCLFSYPKDLTTPSEIIINMLIHDKEQHCTVTRKRKLELFRILEYNYQF